MSTVTLTSALFVRFAVVARGSVLLVLLMKRFVAEKRNRRVGAGPRTGSRAHAGRSVLRAKLRFLSIDDLLAGKVDLALQADLR